MESEPKVEIKSHIRNMFLLTTNYRVMKGAVVSFANMDIRRTMREKRLVIVFI